MAAFWLTLLVVGLLTFGIRVSFIALMGYWEPPHWLRRALRYVPVAVFSAIIFPELFLRNGQLALWPLNPRLIAGLLAIGVAWRTRNIVWTITAGMAVLLVFQALLR